MSGRRTRTGGTHAGYPALRAFCRGYLHEDAFHEHRTIDRVVEAFRADASADEWHAVEADWRRFAADTEGWAFERVAHRFVRALGAAWQPETPDDLARLAAALTGKDTR